MSEKKMLTTRVTKPQKLKLMKLMKENHAIGSGKYFGPDCFKKSQHIWQLVADQLNSCGGAIKNWEQWKKCWIDWKAQVKKQYTTSKRLEEEVKETFAEPETLKPLEGLDKEMLTFFDVEVAEVVVYGDDATREAGLPHMLAESEENDPLTYVVEEQIFEEPQQFFESGQTHVEKLLVQQNHLLSQVLNESRKTNANIEMLLALIKNKSL